MIDVRLAVFLLVVAVVLAVQWKTGTLRSLDQLLLGDAVLALVGGVLGLLVAEVAALLTERSRGRRRAASGAPMDGGR